MIRNFGSHNSPFDLFSHFEWSHYSIAKRIGHRHGPRFLFQRYRLGVPRDSIVVGSVETRKGFEPIQMARSVKDLRIDFNGAMCRKNPGATAGGLFGKCWVGRAVCAQEELWRSACGGLDERLSMDLGLRSKKTRNNVSVFEVKQALNAIVSF